MSNTSTLMAFGSSVLGNGSGNLLAYGATVVGNQVIGAEPNTLVVTCVGDVILYGREDV